MRTSVVLRYTGPAVESGTMDVYAAAANMVAFSDFAVLSAKAAFGDNVIVKAEVSGFTRGSYVTNLLFEIIGPAATIFANASPRTVWELVKDAVALWKHLRGEPPKQIDQVEQTARVTNNNGEIIQVNVGALTVVMSEKGGESVGRFIREALNQDGMDSVEIRADEETVVRIPQSEGGYFVPISAEKTVTDTTIRMALIIEGPEFREGLKWRFSDGQQSFLAEVRDQNFLSRVDRGELFGKGDVLLAEMALVQRQAGLRLVTERIVLRVLEHKSAQKQSSLI